MSDYGYNNYRASPTLKILVNVISFFAAILLVVKLIYGGVNMHNCDIDIRIPIYMVVPLNVFAFTGVAGFFYWNTAWENECITTAVVISGLMSLAWMIFGTVAVFPHKSYVFDGCEINKPCCADTMFRMAFGITVFDWILLVPVICIGVFLMRDS